MVISQPLISRERSSARIFLSNARPACHAVWLHILICFNSLRHAMCVRLREVNTSEQLAGSYLSNVKD